MSPTFSSAVALLVLLVLSGCSGSAGAKDGLRFAVVPDLREEVGRPLLLGIAWTHRAPLSPLALTVTDVLAVPDVGADLRWEPGASAPADARTLCGQDDCTEVATGLIVAIVEDPDDHDGRATLEPKDPAQEGASGLTASGSDLLVGIATDHVAVWAAAELGAGDEALAELGWPVQRGTQIMRVQYGDRGARLEPPTERERVPVYLVGPTGEQANGLCCAPAPPEGCPDEPIRCPDFRNLGEIE